MPASKPSPARQTRSMRPRLGPVMAIALGVLPLPSAAVVTMSNDVLRPAPASFEFPFFRYDNTPLSISDRAYASALFAGQGWGTTQAIEPVFQSPWEIPVGDPTPGAELSLLGQYPPVDPAPPPPSNSVDETKIQNVASFGLPGSGLRPRFGGMNNNYYLGVTSIIFADNLEAISLEIIDAGINQGDGNGGPVNFRLYGRQGQVLGAFEIPRAEDGFVTFRSSANDLAGIQIWHQDPRGLEFSTIVLPIPATVALLLAGIAGLAVSRLSLRGR